MAGGIVMREAHYPGRAPIDAYGGGGFRFAEMSHRGSLLCLPSGIHGWQVDDFASVTFDSLSAVVAEAERIEVLLLGTGPDMQLAPAELRSALREHGIVTEAMSTGSAVRTYNVLLAEDRAVAAALIAVDAA